MRLLIVEDESKLANSLKIALTAEHYAVDVARDGEEGYEAAAIEPYDLIILDIGLPKMDGITVCKKLRKEKILTPIVMLTARDTLSDKIIGLDSGADDYLIKPFELSELIARIRALIRRSDPEPSVILKVGNLTLDPAAHLVKRGKTEIQVSGKEYALLEYLIRHPNQILSKTQLMEHVWDMNTDPFSNVVDVYIGYVRNKIDRAFPKEPPLLSTVKGIGYKLGDAS